MAAQDSRAIRANHAILRYQGLRYVEGMIALNALALLTCLGVATVGVARAEALQRMTELDRAGALQVDEKCLAERLPHLLTGIDTTVPRYWLSPIAHGMVRQAVAYLRDVACCGCVLSLLNLLFLALGHGRPDLHSRICNPIQGRRTGGNRRNPGEDCVPL